MADMTLDDIKDFVLTHPAKHVLGQGADAEAIKLNSFLFANTVSVDLRARGVHSGLLKKPSGSNIKGYAVDIVALKATDGSVEIHDVVFASDTPNAVPSFGDAEDVDPTRFADPDANLGYIVTTTPPTGDPGPGPDPGPVDPPDVDLVKLLTDLHTSISMVERMISQVMPQIDAAFGSIDDRLSRIEAKLNAVPAGGAAPTYEGSFRILGQTIRFTLTPKPQ